MGKLLWVIVGFFLLGGYMIYQGSDYNLGDTNDKISFGKKFAKWLFSVGKKTKNVVGYVVQEDWLPTEGDGVENESDSNVNLTLDDSDSDEEKSEKSVISKIIVIP